MDAESDRPPKVLLTKIGLDGHDRGYRIVSSLLRDAGMEVVFTPPWQEIPDVVRIAMEEDVDVIGISSLASDHLLVPQLMDALREAGLAHIAVILGGTIPEGDDPWLEEAGVKFIARPGTPSEQIIQSVRELVRTGRARAET
jgi:methylmalonyl-CoA mutase C-terminal domain/subunit